MFYQKADVVTCLSVVSEQLRQGNKLFSSQFLYRKLHATANEPRCGTFGLRLVIQQFSHLPFNSALLYLDLSS